MHESIFIAGGAAALVGGASILVRGSSGLAARLGIPPLVIGLTVVAFGTSAPELAVNLRAASSGHTAMALGNVIGSNIFNILFVLGASAIAAPIAAARGVMGRDVPLLIAMTAAMGMVIADGTLSRADGVALAAAGVAYTTLLLMSGRDKGAGPATSRPLRASVALMFVAAGVVLLAAGARWIVDAASSIARRANVDELAVGLTIVAAGTALPEVVTSLVAAVRGQREISIGNIVGSNIFNVVFVLGLTGFVAREPLQVDLHAIRFDLPVLMIVSMVLWPLLAMTVSRVMGAVLLAHYAFYVAFVWLGLSGHPAAGRLGSVWAVLSLVTIAVIVGRWLHGIAIPSSRGPDREAPGWTTGTAD